MNTRPPSRPPLLTVEPFKGINLSTTPTQIDKSQSPDMLNMNIDTRGSLNKRTGYKRLFETHLGNSPINGIFEFKKGDGTKEMLFAHGGSLYRLDDLNEL